MCGDEFVFACAWMGGLIVFDVVYYVVVMGFCELLGKTACFVC